jgi:hypothetical protein
MTLKHWNHRVIRRALPTGEIYDANGKPELRTDNESAPHGETIGELREALELYQKVCLKPALDFETLEEV